MVPFGFLVSFGYMQAGRLKNLRDSLLTTFGS